MAKGRWAQGITPRHFTWVVGQQVAISERPGGYGENHRRVRRQEEIIWIREQGFARVISVIGAPHNLHNYDELGVAWLHRPFPLPDEMPGFLQQVYGEIRSITSSGGKVLVHQEEVSDLLVGFLAGYVVWSRLVEEPYKASAIVERIVGRRLQPPGRQVAALAAQIPGPRTATPAPPRPGGEEGGGPDTPTSDGAEVRG